MRSPLNSGCTMTVVMMRCLSYSHELEFRRIESVDAHERDRASDPVPSGVSTFTRGLSLSSGAAQ